jgi:dolichol-phosphate mannosyltransferase
MASLVLLPTYNERENLTRIVPRLSALEEVDVLVLDDASPDGTGELAEALRGRYARLSVLHRREKEGLGPAYVHGFKEALRRGYERVVTMDADLSHSPEDVPRLLRALESADVAIGSRLTAGGTVVGWPFARRALSRLGSAYARTLLRLPARDVTSGFRAYRAEALSELDLGAIESRGFVFQVEILRRLLDLPGRRVVEIPITFRDRSLGASKLSAGIVAEAVLEVARLSLRKYRLPGRRVALQITTAREAPVASVIIPVRPETAAPRALEALPELSYPREKTEILVARGLAPARQRNEAVRESTGDILLFLDDDSIPGPQLISTYARAFRDDPGLGAIGGPAVPLRGTAIEDLATLLLAEPWVVGRTASRYCPPFRNLIRF